MLFQELFNLKDQSLILTHRRGSLTPGVETDGCSERGFPFFPWQYPQANCNFTGRRHQSEFIPDPMKLAAGSVWQMALNK